MAKRKEPWTVFYLDGKELCSYSAQDTFRGEARETRNLLAYEHGVNPEEIEVRLEYRKGGE